MTPLTQPSSVELRVAGFLRERSVREIEARGNRDEIASSLGLGNSGVQALLSRRDWPLEQAVRVASALGVIDEERLDDILSSPEA